MLFCVHTFLSSFLVLFFLSLSKYIFRLLCFFCCWFFLPHFFVTLLHKDKKCCLGGNNNTPLPTTTRSSKWATNSRRTRRECRCATPSSPLSVFFFVRERARALLFFVNATTRCPPLSQREVVILRFAKDSHKEIFVSSFEIARCN